ncbi:hypothetical protein Tco_0524829 [Tanacetum coccineum]
MKIDLDDKTNVLTYHKKLLAEAQKEKEDLKAKVEKWHNSSKNLSKLLNTQMSANDKFGLGYGDHRYDGILSYENEVLQSVFMNKESELEKQPLYDRFVTAGGMHAVPPPMTGNYMPSGPDIEVDYSQFTYGPKQTQPSESESQTSEFDTCDSNISTEPSELVSEPVVNESNVECQPKVWSDAPIIEEYESDSEDEYVSIPTKEQETPSFANQQVKTPRETVKNHLNHLIRDCDFNEKRMARKDELNNGWNNVQRVNKQNKFVPSAVLTRTMYKEEEQVFLDELEKLKRQEKEANEEAKALRKDSSRRVDTKITENLVIQAGTAKASGTNIFSTVSTIAKANSTNLVNTVSIPISTASPHEGLSLSDPTNPEQDDIEIPSLEDIYKNSTDGIFTNSSYDDEGIVADFTNLETVVNVSPIPTSRIISSHPSALILGDLTLAVQTRSKVNKSSGAHAFVSYVEKQRRNNHKDFQHCLFACFLSQNEPKKILEALEDESWVDAMQEEIAAVFLSKTRDTESLYPLLDLPSRKKLLAQSISDDFNGKSSTFFLEYKSNRKDGIFISQDKYVAEILKKFDFANVKTASTPIETQKPLVKDEEASDVDVHLYRSMIGSLMYLTASRPDIMFAVCACSRFQVTPKTSHLSAVKRIFRYLKGKPKLGLWYPRVSSFDLESYSDSDYAGANLDRKSTTGGCQFLGRRLISWQCKKQTIVATSTTEAEYVAAASCCGQVLWIQNQMLDYGFNFMNTKIYIDNESTICIVKNPVYHSKTKHIAIRHHFIRDAYEKKLIQVLKIHTDDNVADLLTKAFDVSRGLIEFRESLKRVTDGTEALLILTLFILWLDKVSTDSAKLVPLGKVCTAIETLK